MLSLQLYNAQTASLQSLVSGSSGQCTLSLCRRTSLSCYLQPASLSTRASRAKPIPVCLIHAVVLLVSALNRQPTVWSLFTAAYTTDPNVRNSIIDQIWGRVSSNATDTGIFSTSYSLGKAQGAPISNGGRCAQFFCFAMWRNGRLCV